MPQGVNMRKMMQQAAEMQAEVQRRQQDLAEATFEGTSGGGVVTATVQGDGRVLAVSIDPTVLDPDDPELAGDLVVAAVTQAQAAAAEAMADSLGSVGGLDIGGLFG